jgi:hypothetical protein
MYVEPPTGHYMSPDRPPAGVGGWLAFFVIVTVFASGFSLIANLGSLVGDTGALVREFPYIHARAFFFLTDHIAWLAVNCYGINAGIQPWRIAPRAVETAKRYLVLFGLLAFAQFAGLLILWAVDGSAAVGLTRNASDGNFETVMDFGRSIIYSLLWCSYFNQSVRVANTYNAPAATGNEGVPA